MFTQADLAGDLLVFRVLLVGGSAQCHVGLKQPVHAQAALDG